MQQGCLSKLQDLPYLPGIDKDFLAIDHLSILFWFIRENWRD